MMATNYPKIGALLDLMSVRFRQIFSRAYWADFTIFM